MPAIAAGGPDDISKPQNAASLERKLTDPFDGKSVAGNYLAARFAQRRHEWGEASNFLNHVLKRVPDSKPLIKRAMILAMGSGHFDTAVALANDAAQQDDNALPLLFLIVDTFKAGDFDKAQAQLDTMPTGSLSNFMMPLMRSWIAAARGKNESNSLHGNSVHIYHAILIADFLNQHDHIENLLKKAAIKQSLGAADMERIADIYAHIGQTDKAKTLYESAAKKAPDYVAITRKLADLETGHTSNLFKTMSSPQDGMAEALYDMSRILFSDYNDDSARVFANMALHLNPNLADAKFLLANLSARNEHTQQAITYYKMIGEDNPRYGEARRRAASLLEDLDQDKQALKDLNNLLTPQGDIDDVDTLIQIADIHRRNEDFDKSLASYNKAETLLGGTISKEYWHLLYTRGMAYEQAGQWEKAEHDLLAALEHQPDHPFIMNYLGYSWADRGENLTRAMKLIEHAAELRPEDGHIADSLGWVLYKTGQLESAIKHLETAVELLPYDYVVNDHLGDAYWQAGRKLEARFQWKRARNFTQDEASIAAADAKIKNGINDLKVVKEARSETAKKETSKPQ